jgi:protein-S-isoprenylcysteine O-methyltransferase Ste14
MFVKKLVKWSQKKRSKREKFIVSIMGVIFFLFLLPLIFIKGGYLIDSLLGLQILLVEPVNFVLGALLAIVGWSFAIWSVYVLYRIGKGTPAPFVPTQRLVRSGPYKYCRNPMVFGALLFYIGIAIISNTPSMLLILIPVSFIPFLIFIKLIEEKELEIRFGKEYIEYKKRTPFLIPYPKRRKVIKIGNKN